MDDAIGQTVRDWTIINDEGHIFITGGTHPNAYGPVSFRSEDLERFIADLHEASGRPLEVMKP